MAMDDSRLRRIATLSKGDWSLVLDSHAPEHEPYQPLLQELTGWYGGTGVSAENNQRQLGHGSFESEAVRTARQLTLGGLFFFENESDREFAARYISGALWDGSHGELTYQIEGQDPETTTVRLDGEPKITPIADDGVQWELPLIAEDPRIYGPVRVSQIFPTGFGEGFVFPAFATKQDPDGSPVADWGAGTPYSGGFGNNGNATAYPVFTVRGDWPAGFSITAGGHTLTYPAPVSASVPCVIDNAEGTVSIGGVGQTHRLTARHWFDIAPGESLQPRIIALGGQSNGGWCDVEIRDTYM